MSSMHESGGPGARNQLDQVLRSVTEEIDRLEADNRNLAIERDRLSRMLAEAERRSALSAQLLIVAQRESRRRVDDAMRQGALLREFAQRQAAELRARADLVLDEAAAEAAKLEETARAEAMALSSEIDRLVLQPTGEATQEWTAPVTPAIEPVALAEREVPAVAMPVVSMPVAPEPVAPIVAAPVVPEPVAPLAAVESRLAALSPTIVEVYEPIAPQVEAESPSPREPFTPQAAVPAFPITEPTATLPLPEVATPPAWTVVESDAEVTGYATRPSVPAAEPIEEESPRNVLPIWAAIDRLAKTDEAESAPVWHEPATPVAPFAPAEPKVDDVPAESAGPGNFELVASPFNSFSTLVAFQRAVKSIAEIDDVRAKSFLNGALHLTLRYSGSVPIADRLRALAGFRPERMAITGNRIDMIVAPDEGSDVGRTSLSGTA